MSAIYIQVHFRLDVFMEAITMKPGKPYHATIVFGLKMLSAACYICCMRIPDPKTNNLFENRKRKVFEILER